MTDSQGIGPDASKTADSRYSGMAVGQAITTHLGLYRPGSIGPTAWDLALFFCAGLDQIRDQLTHMEAHGKVRRTWPGIAPGELPPDDMMPHWELTSQQP